MQNLSDELENKVCVITGGGRGIGAAIAETFVGQKARVALLDRDAALAAETRDRLREQNVDVRAYTVDITDESAVEEAARQIAGDFGSVDVLVNNAGIGKLGASMTYRVQDFRESMEVMTTGVFSCSREFGRLIRQNGGGTIVNISSINGIVAFPMRLAYSAAKAAVISMTKVLAVEWASYGIRVNAVAPGNTETEMVRDAVRQGLIDVEAYYRHTPLKRFAQPEEIADTVLYLAGDRSRYITGQVIVPDGGWTAFGWVPWSGDPDDPQPSGS